MATTSMAKALSSGHDSVVLKQNPRLQYKQGEYSWSITDGIYSVTDGKETIRLPLGWAFGVSEHGQTYVYQRNGVFFEATVSYYSGIKGLDITPGQSPPFEDLERAAGRSMSAAEAKRCFGCHSGGVRQNQSLNTDSIEPGVRCEHCHAGAGEHAAGMKAGKSRRPMTKLAGASADRISDLCGSCHRTYSEISASGMHGSIEIRFQPYRLELSKSFDGSDARIACTACHNPHASRVTQASFYDAKCGACHDGGKPGAVACPVAKRDCASCHMPATEVPDMHGAFTDHNIRVVRPGAK